MKIGNNHFYNRGWWLSALAFACCCFISAATNAQDFCPQQPIAICGLPGSEVCVDLPITGADTVLVDGGSWSDGKLCFTPTAFGENNVTVRGIFGSDTTTCTVVVVLGEGTKPTITCPEEPFDIFMCGPGLACIAAPMAKDAGRVFAQGAEVSGGNLCVNVDTSGTYYITLYAVNDCGADSCTVTVNVKIGTKPEIECPVMPDGGIKLERCDGGQLCYPLTVTGADQVSVPGGSFADGQLCFNADTTGHYTFTAYAQNECGVTQCQIAFDVTINTKPVIACPMKSPSVVSCAGTICVPLGIDNADSVSVTGGTYENGQLCFTAEQSGQYPISVTAYNECGSVDCSFMVSVKITPAPVIGCTHMADSTTLCAPGQVCIKLPITGADSVSVEGNATWADGQLCFFAKASGTYTFTVHASNECGTTDCKISRTIIIQGVPVIACPSEQIQATVCQSAELGVVKTYLPITGADSVAILAGSDKGAFWENDSLAVYGMAVGPFTVTLAAFNNCGADTCSVSFLITAIGNPLITCPDSAFDITLCQAGQFCVALPVSNATKVIAEGATWQDGMLCATAEQSGELHYTVIASNQCGVDSCTVTVNVTVGSGVLPAIACPLSEQSVSVCSLPDSVSVSIGVESAAKVVVFSNDAQGTWENGVVTFVASEAKLYTFTVVASNDCGSDTCMFAVNVLQTPNPVIVCPEGDLAVSVCDSGTVCIPLTVMNATSVIAKGGVSAQWADGQLCFAADTAGRYGFLIMATNDCGNAQCGIAVNVTLGEAPQACFTPQPDSGAVPLTVFFANCSITTGDAKFAWDFGDSTTNFDAEPTHVFKAPGCYEVTLTVTTDCGQSTTSHTVCATGGQIIVPTPEWINVYCATPMLDDVALMPGDIITAYDPDGVLCGMDVVRANGQFGFMPVYRDDIYSDGVDEGAEPGDVISFRVNGTPVFTGSAVTWTANGDSYQLCNFLTHTPLVCKTLHLHTGWNLISWNVAWSSGIEDFIADYAECIDVVLGFDQGALTYDPSLPEYSTLWNVDYHFGYWFKMNCDADVQVCGNPIDANDGINVYSGWNLISYWPEDTLSVEAGFASIIDQVQVSLGYNGTGLVYQPGQGAFNTLISLSEFNGYWVRSTENMVLAYPGFTPSGGGKVSGTHASTTPVSHNWISVYGKNLTLDGSALAAGTKIEMRSQSGAVCGSAVYSGSVLKFTPVYGTDGVETAQYPHAGEAVQVFVNGQRTYPDIAWGASGERVNISSRFSTSDHAALPTTYSLGQNYPNPFNPTTQISFSLMQNEKIRLSVFNVLGQRIATIADGSFAAGEHTVEWNGRDDAGKPVTSGIYFYRLDTPSFNQTKKMVLMK